MAIMGSRDKQIGREAVLTDYSRRRLLNYAESFQDLADSLSFDFYGEGEDRQEILERKCLWEKQQVLCENMNEVSRVLSEMASEVFQFVPLPERQQRRIINALRGEKIFVGDLFYIDRPLQKSGQVQQETCREKEQGRQRTSWEKQELLREQGRLMGVCMSTERPGGYTATDVADMLSVLLDNRFVPGATCPYRLEKESKFFFFVEEPGFLVLPGYARAIRENETVSGDNYTIVESVKGQLTVLLSDGMGSGEKACRDSEKVLDLMEKLLEAGFDITTAMNLLNNSLAASQEQQNMSTLDVCSLDLYTGMCEFYKAGGATTFLKSNAYVEKISMNTMPLGIFQGVEPAVVHRELIENDYVIMVTDGVIECLSAGGYEDMLCSYIEGMQETNSGEIARKILQLALRCSGGRIMDDMTVVVLGVFRGR